ERRVLQRTLSLLPLLCVSPPAGAGTLSVVSSSSFLGGECPLILEALVTTLDAAGAPHLAPMGPRVAPDFKRFTLRPFPTSNTYQNLLRHGAGVLHVTDDALLLARAAIGVATLPPVRAAEHVRGFVLTDCCRFFEFTVQSIDASGERVNIEADVVHCGRVRD